MALTTDTVILRAAIALALERGLDFSPDGFVDVDGVEVSPLDFALMVSARLGAPVPEPDESGSTPPGSVPVRTGVRALRQIVRARQSMMTRLLAEAEHAYEAALRTAGLKVIARARSRTGKQRAAAVCSAVEHHDPLEPWLTAVGVTEMEMLDHAFDTFRSRAGRELERYRERVLAIAASHELTLSPTRFDLDGAVQVLVAGLTAMARSRLLHGDEAMMSAVKSKLPDVPRAVRAKVPENFDPGFVGRFDTDQLSRAAASLVRNATNVAEGNGTFRLPTTGDTMPDVMVDRTTPDLMEELAVEFTVSPLWTWVHGFYGEPLSEFAPHAYDMDGIETTDRDTDERLLNPEPFPADDYFYPGDHDGCTCEWIPIEGGEAGDVGQQPAPTEVVPPETLARASELTREERRARMEERTREVEAMQTSISDHLPNVEITARPGSGSSRLAIDPMTALRDASARFASDVPDMAPRITEIKMKPDLMPGYGFQRVYAFAATNADGTYRLEIDQKLMSIYSDLKTYTAEAAQNGFHPADSPEAFFTHEFAHTLDAATVGDRAATLEAATTKEWRSVSGYAKEAGTAASRAKRAQDQAALFAQREGFAEAYVTKMFDPDAFAALPEAVQADVNQAITLAGGTP